MNEISLMSQISKHLHVHDSFGNLNNMYTYNESEDLSYGFGDLHLPLGWGDIPFDKIFEEVKFPEKVNLFYLLVSDFTRPRPMDISFNPYRVLKSFIKQFYEVGIKEKGHSLLRNS